MESENKEILDLLRENNKMLHKVRGVQKRQAIFSILKWIIIIGIFVGSYYIAQPFIGQMQKFIKDSGVSIDQLKNLGNTLQSGMPNIPKTPR